MNAARTGAAALIALWLLALAGCSDDSSPAAPKAPTTEENASTAPAATPDPAAAANPTAPPAAPAGEQVAEADTGTATDAAPPAASGGSAQPMPPGTDAAPAADTGGGAADEGATSGAAAGTAADAGGSPAAGATEAAPSAEDTAASEERNLAGAETGEGPAPQDRETVDAPAGGQTHVVTARATAFDPVVLFIQPGDTVSWTNMIGHDTDSLDEEGMIPEGATPWKSALGENFSVTLTVPGAYIYKCNPHYSMGMLGAIVVGDASVNLAQIEASPENKGVIGRVVRKLKQELENRPQ